jgi:hypothetical protein
LSLIRQGPLYFRCIYSERGSGLIRHPKAGRSDRVSINGLLADVELVPSMPVEVAGRTNERTALSYLVRPMHDQITRAFREE